MIRSVRVVLSLAVLAVLLGACGVVNSFIPDQKVADPLGLDGTAVTLDQGPATMTALQASATTTFSGTFATTFDDIDTSSLPSGVGPNGLDVPLGVQADVTLASPTAAEGDFPATVTVTHASLAVHAADGSGSPSLDQTFEDSGTLLTLEKGSCSAAPVSCSYTVSGASASAALLLLQIHAKFPTLWTIATSGDASNDLSGTFALDVSADSALPADATMSVTLSSGDATLTF